MLTHANNAELRQFLYILGTLFHNLKKRKLNSPAVIDCNEYKYVQNNKNCMFFALLGAGNDH
jgi:hypothetical protein